MVYHSEIAQIMTKKAKKEDKKRLIRIPLEIDKKLQSRAKRMQRSVNAQIIYELDQQPA